MNIKNITLKGILLAFVVCTFLVTACSKDDYYFDSGKSDPVFKGTALDYLKSKPFNFDTIATIVKLAGMEKEFTEDSITFFAPQDYSVRTLMITVNSYLFTYGKDTVKKLEDIDGKIWRKYLSNYVYRGVNRLKDYPQVDLAAKGIYPGQNYLSYNDEVFNIGVRYSDAGGVKYSGYRQLLISYIPDQAQPLDNWFSVTAISSDIQPDHSIIHVLSNVSSFGFDAYNFAQDVYLSK